MSVTASQANVEPPPLLFGQRSPSPPSFSSPPQSPNHLQHSQTPVASPPHTTTDVDMSTSTTLRPPGGQNHDREEDALMQDSEGLANGHVEVNPHSINSQEPPATSVAVEVAAIDEDAMDTTPDNSQGLVLPNGSSDPQEPPGITSISPAPNEQSNSEEPPLPSTDSTSQADLIPPIEPPPPFDPNAQPPPPPPEAVRTDSDSSDDDDGQQPWHPIQEDTSSPDETELKEIEAGTEISALDHDHWEEKAFTPLEDPEYTPGPSGRIEWAIENYNGTREKPNREVLMKSEPVNIGGYEWQIKFYPKGNDSDYLSVYVECLSVGDKKTNQREVEGSLVGSKDDTSNDSNENDSESSKEDTKTATEESNEPTEAPSTEMREPQHAPLPLLDAKSVPRRKSVAAQVSVVLYNPEEPRVNYSRTCLHRFCTGSPDWGWTRFHGPYYDIPHRIRGQRQALLRNDKLAFTGYIRVIEDVTCCLWEHHSRDNPWDSFAMTGLQSLTLGEDTAPPGGNMISAIASWLLFKPFRLFLYNFRVPIPDTEPFVRPKPLIAALQKVLYMLRTQVDPGAGPVTLDDVLDALDWYGIHERLDKVDVIEVWEILRLKLEDELQDTPQSGIFDDFFGLKRDYALGLPSYRAPVLGVSSMQEAVNKATNLTHPSQPLPQLLTIELDRQEFDIPTRSYVKLLNKVSLDEHIIVRQTPYTLFGFVVHKQTLQSYVYHPILRPEGPDSRWYNYTDGKEENQVKCLSKRQAVDAHEGKSGSGKIVGNDAVAYIVMYIRDDVAKAAFECDAESEQWEVPQWIRDEVKRQQTAAIPPMPPPPVGDNPTIDPETENLASRSEQNMVPVEEPIPAEVHDFQVIDSRAFLQHEGPGTFEAYDPKWQSGTSDLLFSVQLQATDGCKEIREKLATVVRDIRDPRQIKFWFLDTLRGTFARPNLLGTGEIEYSSGSTDRYADKSKQWTLQDSPYSWSSRRIWIHVIDFADLPPPPKEEVKQVSEANPAPPPEMSASQEPPSENLSAPEDHASPPPEPVPHAEDTPMSEPDEPAAPIPEVQSPETLEPEVQSPELQVHGVQPSSTEDNNGLVDTAMTEVEVDLPVELVTSADPSAVDVAVANTSAPIDTEMGGTLENAQPPPPPPPEFESDTAPPEAPPVQEPEMPEQHNDPPPDEIYFFLKFFNAETQTLEARGSYIAQKAARVDSTVSAILTLPSDKKLELLEEEDLTTTRPIRLRRSFAQNDLHNTAVIIAILPLTDEQRDELAGRAAFADIQSFLAFRALARNFPTRLSGHFTYSYFSAQFYKGEMKNGHRHGHGTRIYHSGATYEGSFRLGQRHGHGLYTFQNGDTYDGDWVENQQHGSGTFVEATTGNTYVGGWKNDKKFGEGVTHWKNAQETEQLCRICWEDEADAAFYDCGHVVACLPCARQVQSCPVCRKRVLSAMKLYYVA